MQNIKLQREIYCVKCKSPKKLVYCDVCRCKTANLFKVELSVIEKAKTWMRNLMKSYEMIGNKPKREIEQYVGNKDENVISEFERLRKEGKSTHVVHRLWRKFDKNWKKIHEHEK